MPQGRHRLRVLHVISGIDPRLGGPPAALVGLVRAQAACGLKPTVVSTYRNGDDLSMREALREAGVECVAIGPTLGPLCWHQTLDREVAAISRHMDVVHIHAIWEEIQHVAARTSRRLGRPYVVSPHGMIDAWSMAQHSIRKRIAMQWRVQGNLDGAVALHCTSAMESHEVRTRLPKAKVIVIPNGVQWSDYAELPARGAFRAQELCGFSGPMILHLGRIHPVKNIELVIDAVSANRLPDEVRLVVIGPAELRYLQTLKARAASRGVFHRVHFLPSRFGLRKLEALVDADCFALASYHENFGIAVAEALAAGIPAVVSDAVAIGSEIAEHRAGLCLPRDVDSWVESLETMLSDPAVRLDMGRRARDLVRRRFAWDAIGARWRDVYAELILG